MNKIIMQKISGTLQIFWSLAAFLFGGFSYSVLAWIISAGGIFPETPQTPLTAVQIFVLIIGGLIIAGGCAMTLFLGIGLIKKGRKNSRKNLISIMSMIILCFPPLIATYALIRLSFSPLLVASPIFILLLAPVLMVITNGVSLLLKQPETGDPATAQKPLMP